MFHVSSRKAHDLEILQALSTTYVPQQATTQEQPDKSVYFLELMGVNAAQHRWLCKNVNLFIQIMSRSQSGLDRTTFL